MDLCKNRAIGLLLGGTAFAGSFVDIVRFVEALNCVRDAIASCDKLVFDSNCLVARYWVPKLEV